MKDLIKLTSIIKGEHPTYVMKNKILLMTRIKDEFTAINMNFSVDDWTYIVKVKELPEDINKDINLLKFTNEATGKPVYIARDAIIEFVKEPGQEVTSISLMYPISQDFIVAEDEKQKYLNGIMPCFRVIVKESLEEVRKIIEGD